MPDVSLSDILSDERSPELQVWLGSAYGLNKVFDWRINELFLQCTMLHSAQRIGPTVHNCFPPLPCPSQILRQAVFLVRMRDPCSRC